MNTSRGEFADYTLVSFMYTDAEVRTKTDESPREYQIPMHTVFDILKSFLYGRTSAIIQLQLIEDKCTLFKLAEVSEGEA
jgi:hypothetical protein